MLSVVPLCLMLWPVMVRARFFYVFRPCLYLSFNLYVQPHLLLSLTNFFELNQIILRQRLLC